MRRVPRFAPVFISVYDRPTHFKSCVVSLLENEQAQHTSLYISSDGPRDDESVEKVSMVRDYIKSISGFKSVYSFCPRDNTRGEIKKAVINRLNESYPAHIRMEDDNVVSPHFLRYMNDCLSMFWDDPTILGISGFSPPINQSRFTNKSVYLSHFWSAWTSASWLHKDRDQYLTNMFPYADMLANDLVNKVATLHPRLHLALRRMDEGSHQAADQKLTYFMIKLGLYQIRPVHSLVQNIGLDGSGVNCGMTSRFNFPPYPRELDVSDGHDGYISKLDRLTYRYFYPNLFSKAGIAMKFNALLTKIFRV